MSKSLITKTKVKHIAKLAKLPLSDKEISKFSSQLSNILGYMNKISQLKISASKTAPYLNLTNRFRFDKIDKSQMLTQKKALSQAKKTYKGHFVVKSIFK